MNHEEIIKKVAIAQYLTKEELVELVKEIQQESQYWKRRFDELDREYDLACFQYRIPRY